MNKTAIKNFAIWSRVNLIESAKQKAFEYEITKDGTNNKNLKSVGGRLLTATEMEQRSALIDEIKAKGFDQVMEEAAYTWFNRFIALRYMEVNGFLPSHVRVFTNEDGEFKPEIMKEAMTVEIDGLDREKVFDLLEKQNNEELYKYLLITQCNALGEGLPKMFEKIAHWTELLFPANLLRSDSVIGKMVSEIPEEDFTDAVQIIGWLYQYYNTELKDDTFAKLKKNIKISKERIPAATQLFTPDWIVRYMVENSLGRIYVSARLSVVSGQSESERIEAEKAIAEEMGWKYYLPEAEQTPEVRAELNKLTTDHDSLTDLKVIDPCMGSGHILVYAFDVLMQIYTSAGWSERDAAKSIVENNLYGLDIDDRAGQLAYFAVMMKARKYNRRALAGGASGVLPNVYAIKESNRISAMAIDDFCNGNTKVKAEMDKLMAQMHDAKEYGSILNIRDINFDLLFTRCDECVDEIHFHQNEIDEDIIPLIKIAYIMAQKYDVVVTNPPYAGAKGLSEKVSTYLAQSFPLSKADLFAVFIEKCYSISRNYAALVTPSAWMYNPRFESLREKYEKIMSINSLIELGSDAFDAGFGTVTYILNVRYGVDYKGTYFDVSNSEEKTEFKSKKEYVCAIRDFSDIDGKKLIFKIPPKLRNIIVSAPRLQEFGNAGNGLQTNDNGRFIREWYEVKYNKIDFSRTKNQVCANKKWYPTVKTTSSLKWYGNMCSVVNWENDGMEIKALTTQKYGTYTKHVQNLKYYFVEGLTWSHSTYGAPFSLRYMPNGVIINIEGPGIFDLKEKMYYALGILNSNVAMQIFENTTGSIHFVASDLANFPFIFDGSVVESVNSLVVENIEAAKKNWDSVETSWDFKKHPLV